jgi:thiamine pyrophosphokinase
MQPRGETVVVVVVVAGGDAPPADAARGLPDDAYVIAADSGLDHARDLGLAVDVVVGDMDSVSEASLAEARAAGTLIDEHPPAKDQTDLELALDRAIARQPERVVVLGGGGGRLDHLVAGALALTSDRYAGCLVEARLGPATVTVIRREAVLRGEPGSLVTLLPVGGVVTGVVTEDLRYPLRGEDLSPGTTRGVSNEMLGSQARVRLRDGVLLAVQPEGS